MTIPKITTECNVALQERNAKIVFRLLVDDI